MKSDRRGRGQGVDDVEGGQKRGWGLGGLERESVAVESG